MKTISMEVWELDALAHNEKTCKRTPLRLQPTKDASGMWHWKDYQWMDGGLGFPQSGVEDHLFYQPGDIVGVQNSAFESGSRVFGWSSCGKSRMPPHKRKDVEEYSLAPVK